MTHSNYYADVPLARDDLLRRDDSELARLRLDPLSRVLVLWHDKHQVVGDDQPTPIWHSGKAAQELLSDSDKWILLGTHDGLAHFAIDMSYLTNPSEHSLLAEHANFMDLRSIGPLLARADSSVMAYARGMVFWNRRNMFCGACGGETKHMSAGHVRKCTNINCGLDHFPRTDPAVIVLAVHDDECLLGRQKIWPKGMRSTLAGFLEPGESLEETVVRELREEAGVKLATAPIYQHSQPWPFPCSLMVGFYARAATKTLFVNTDELETADWFSREELLNSPENESFRLPRRDSIARRLIEDWLSGSVSL